MCLAQSSEDELKDPFYTTWLEIDQAEWGFLFWRWRVREQGG